MTSLRDLAGGCRSFLTAVFTTCALAGWPLVGQAQPPGTAPGTAPADPTYEEEIDVVATTPLPGLTLTREQLPAPVQTATAEEIDASGALNLSDFLNRRGTAVHINEIQGNPFQVDLNYRGYTASPLLGTPQGISVFMDGVRMNQPFGEVVSWDLIPRIALASSTVMPGSNPMFGLNTLGGSLVLQTKDGLTHKGTNVQALYGRFVRRALEVEHGGARANGALNWYLAANLFGEDGWRTNSPSDVRQLFGKLGYQRGKTLMNVSLAHANTELYGNGIQEQALLARDYRSIYTQPDITDNRATWFNASVRHPASERLTYTGNVYYRHIKTNTLNGDVNEESLGESLYQPSAAERAALIAAGFPNVPASGANAENTPFPFYRCLANILLADEPGEKCNGLLNRTNSLQHSTGFNGQASWIGTRGRARHQVTVGTAFDWSGLSFGQSSELGFLNPDRSVAGTGTFADGESAGEVEGEPFDLRVDLDGIQRTWSLYATDTITLNDRLHVTVSGRYNHTRLENRDQIVPGGQPGSLDGTHTFARFNPSAGLTYSPRRSLNVYAGYSEGSRAATSIELGCADPEHPCRLPNSMAGDPPLDQVVTRTFEAGVRGGLHTRTQWNAGVYQAENWNDILFVASESTGFGYFRNFGRTRRVGLELGARHQVGQLTIGAGYNWLAATFRSEETVNGAGNSSNEEAEEGFPGLEGTIEIEPGDQIPLMPHHTVKVFADWTPRPALTINLNVIGISSSLARGNENGEHEPDGVYYMGPGQSPGYAVTNVSGRYRVTSRVQVFLQVNNLFDRQYYSGAQLGANAFNPAGNFVARQFPAVGGEFPVRQSTFFAPGAPRTAIVGTRVSF